MLHSSTHTIQTTTQKAAMTVSIVDNNTNNDGSRPKRAFATHTPKWQRFQSVLMVPSEKAAIAVSKQATEVYAYSNQYSHVYDHRLVSLKPRCWQSMLKDKPSNVKEVGRVLELREDVPSMVVGTLVKETTDTDEAFICANSKCRPSDQLFLEDVSGRVALALALALQLQVGIEHVHKYCTGVVVGAMGTVDKDGVLQVSKLYTPDQAPHPTIQGQFDTEDEENDSPPHLMLVSGLLCGDPSVSSLPRDMLLSYLQGHFTPDAKKVCRVIVAGPSVSSVNALDGIKELDAWGVQLGNAGIPVDIVPAKSDPTTANWPQRPLHSSLFPHSSTTRLWNRTPNPYAAGHGNIYVVGTDGENIKDLCQSILKLNMDEKKNDSDTNDAGGDTDHNLVRLTELEALRQTLDWSHMCPTGPDSVPTVPHVDSDPMVLDQTPHVYFSGNASKFHTELIESEKCKTRLVCLPNFSETGEAVLVNLKTLDVQVLRFDENAS
jgi:DNA polymerase delta subunit 2